MKAQVFTVFTGPTALGNPAEVLLVDQLPDLQAHLHYIKSRPDYTGNTPSNNTVVYLKPLANQTFAIRWFNNKNAIKRCGHGTLAAAAFIHNQQKNHSERARYDFVSDSETLNVLASQNSYSLAFPTTDLRHIKLDSSGIDIDRNTATDTAASNNKHDNSLVFSAFNNPHRYSQTENEEGYIIIELKDMDTIKCFKLNHKITELIEKRALIISAKSKIDDSDIVFRYFAPQYGQMEDTATGSAGSVLWPFWRDQFNARKRILRCSQLSKEGGYLSLSQTVKGKVLVSGNVNASPNNEY
ncbi:MAG: putative PhzF superfamily epimerase YddE/YHI9 [Cellvibrionaceae bacterium]|jgi:predicted PhzF superfamily epimerase YddE/YHI9